MISPDTPFCRRCLLREFADGKKLYALIREYIEAIPEDERTGAGDYEKRLAACRACEWLVSGMCRQCGCYVEARAAKARQRCPDAEPRW